MRYCNNQKQFSAEFNVFVYLRTEYECSDNCDWQNMLLMGGEIAR